MTEPENQNTPAASADDLAQVERLRTAFQAMKDEMSKVIVGQDKVIDELFIALFCRGHCVLVGVPGLAKTLTISTLSKILDLSFNRIQFTPDLRPADITGTEVIQEDKQSGERMFRFLKGPVFANVILADEINRTPPKTQSALLEAMQEYQITVAGQHHPIEKPFFVLATQNPIEQEGTYPLPEAQLDRFMFMLKVDYPELEEEREILRRTTETKSQEVSAVITTQDILELQQIVRRVPIADQVLDYALRLTRATRITTEESPNWVKESLSWGAGPRASQFLVLAGKARALLHGRFHVSAEDIREIAHPVLRHRIVLSYGAEAEGMTPDHVIDRLLEEVSPNHSEALADGKLPSVLKE
ncbi:MAG: MoxR family ATPase [Planctomycetota bacterium]